MVIEQRSQVTQVIVELHRIKRRLNLSQVQLARRIGVTQPAVRSWLIGESLPSGESLGKIATAFPELTNVIVRAALGPILSGPGACVDGAGSHGEAVDA